MKINIKKPQINNLCFRMPNATNGTEIWNLIQKCKPLDQNSMYCNLVQADHFRDTCVVAELNGKIVGWISGHIIPQKNEMFIWQVAVCDDARGLGVGKKMLSELLQRKVTQHISKIQTTITKDNLASWGLFKSFSSKLEAELSHKPYYKREQHFDNMHDTEHLVTIQLPSSELRAITV